MTGHASSIYSLAFSAESSLLVSGGADWTVRCWDVKGAGGARTSSSSSAKTQRNGSTEEDSAETFVSPILLFLDVTDLAYPSVDMLASFPTKRTPITDVQFTSRNLCLVGGVYSAPETR